MENFTFLTIIGQYFLSTIDFIKEEIIKFFSKFKQIKDDEETITDRTKRRKSGSIIQTNIELPDEENISLIITFEEIEVAMNLFLSNEFLEAKEILSPHKDSSMYHALVYSVIAVFEVMLSYDKEKSDEISLLLEQCIKLGDNSKQKGFSLRKKFNNEEFNDLNDFKIHAKLCSNEALLIGLLLTYLEQRFHSGVFKATSNIPICYSGYRRCETILNKRTTWYTEECKLRFQNGICFGLGVFHLMVTFLPKNVIRFLEIVGYGGTKEKGLEYLKTGCDLPGYHKSLCVLMLLGYNLSTIFEFSHKFGDLEQCNTVLENILELHPTSVWFLLTKAKYETEIGDLDNALIYYLQAINEKKSWSEFNILCYLDMYYIYTLQLQWEEATLYADYIIDQEGPMAHDQPTYASVPGIRVFGMMCVKPGYSVRKPSAQPPKRYQLQKPYYIPSTQNKYSIIKDNRPSSSSSSLSSSSSNGYQTQSQPQIHDSYQLQHQANYQYLNRPESSPIISSGANTHKDYSDIQINHFSPGVNSGSVYGRNNERKTSSIVAEDSSDTIESDQETIENSTGSDIENQDDKPINRERRSILNDVDSITYNDDQMPEFPWNKVMEFQSSLVWEE